jgi:hypothetical protein
MLKILKKIFQLLYVSSMMLICIILSNAYADSTFILNPTDDGTINRYGSVINHMYLNPDGVVQGVVEFPLVSISYTIKEAVLSVNPYAENPYGLPRGDNTVEVYGYESTDGLLTSSDYDAGVFLGVWTLPNNLGYGEDAFFDVTDFLKNVTTSYVGFNLRSEGNRFSSLEYNYGHPAQLKVVNGVVGEPVATVTDLIADGGSVNSATDIGDVTVWNMGDMINIKYETDGEWCITKTFLHVATSLDMIPQTKKGNPKPGHFDYKNIHDCIQIFTTMIPLEYDLCTELVIAAQAEVKKTIHDTNKSKVKTEKAWAAGESFPGKDWAMYLIHIVQDPEQCFDGVDNDCDEMTDCGDIDDCEGDTNRECVTEYSGICAEGVLTCTMSGKACVSLNEPVDEICDDGLDNDCDGLTDDEDGEDCQAICPCWDTELILSYLEECEELGECGIHRWSYAWGNYYPLWNMVLFLVGNMNAYELVFAVDNFNIMGREEFCAVTKRGFGYTPYIPVHLQQALACSDAIEEVCTLVPCH